MRVSALWEAAVTTGVEKGYGGKGTFYAWAAGNGGDNGDNSNLEEYTNFYAITPVCAVNDSGIRSDFSELGANLWVCAPSNDLRAGYRGIVATENSDRYQNTFGGTSASTPIVSGVAALLRDANPELTWRDLKLILAASARKNDPDNSGWEDGAFKYGSTTKRYHFNHEYGFGVVDAKADVDLSKEWTNVPPLESATKTRSVNRRIFDAPASGATDTLTLTTDIAFIEFVEVRTNFQHSSFRDLEIELESPAGKVSTLVGPYETDIGLPLYGEFRFGAAKHLGENPNGRWTLRVTDRVSGVSGTLDSWTIKVYGHMLTPAAPAVDSVTPGEDSLIVAWSAPAVNRGTGVTSYDLRHIPTAADETEEDNWTVVGDIWTVTHGEYLERRVTGLAGNTQYDVQVRAVNQAGAGPWSETATGTPKVSAATLLHRQRVNNFARQPGVGGRLRRAAGPAGHPGGRYAAQLVGESVLRPVGRRDDGRSAAAGYEAGTQREVIGRADSPRPGWPRQPGNFGPVGQRPDRDHTNGVGQPHQFDGVAPQPEPVDWGDTSGVG